MTESDLTLEKLAEQKVEARRKLLELPPAEAQAKVESILYPQYWQLDPNQPMWHESFALDDDEIDA